MCAGSCFSVCKQNVSRFSFCVNSRCSTPVTSTQKNSSVHHCFFVIMEEQQKRWNKPIKMKNLHGEDEEIILFLMNFHVVVN